MFAAAAKAVDVWQPATSRRGSAHRLHRRRRRHLRRPAQRIFCWTGSRLTWSLLPGVRIDVVGVGADTDSLLLDELARRFGGASRYVVSGGDEVRAALDIVAAQYVAALADASIRVVPAKGSKVRLIEAGEVYPGRPWLRCRKATSWW